MASARHSRIKLIRIDAQSMRRMSEWRAKFGNCGSSSPSPVISSSLSVKRVVISGSVFRVSYHLLNVYTDTVHILRLLAWVHWYRCCIISGTRPQHVQRLVDECNHCCRKFMVDRIFLIHCLMTCVIWTVVFYCDRSNFEGLFYSQSTMWVSFWST